MRSLGRHHQTLSCHRMPHVLVDVHLMIILAFSCNLQGCVAECINSVLANRSTLFPPEGGSVSLQCKVQDCGQKGWRGGWGLTTDGHFTFLRSSSRLHLSNYTVSANSSRLQISIQNLNQSDSGGYQCQIVWKEGHISQGHVTYINVTTTESMRRKRSHRLLVIAAASLCFPLALGLARCLSAKQLRVPPVPSHFRGTSFRQMEHAISPASARVKPKAEVVYAAVTLKSPRQQIRPEIKEPTVYSSLNFSTA